MGAVGFFISNGLLSSMELSISKVHPSNGGPV